MACNHDGGHAGKCVYEFDGKRSDVPGVTSDELLAVSVLNNIMFARNQLAMMLANRMARWGALLDGIEHAEIVCRAGNYEEVVALLYVAADEEQGVLGHCDTTARALDAVLELTGLPDPDEQGG
jgi:hypothetical protein